MKSRRAKDEVKHEAILKAATKLFLKNGYSNTSMDAIADAARVTKQTVYSHYQNKDTLFAQMVSALCDKYTPRDAAQGHEPDSPETLLTQVGMSFISMITSPEGLASTRLAISEVHTHPKLAQRYYEDGTKRMMTMLAQALDRLKKRGLVAIVDTESAASYFFAMLKGRYYLRVLFGIKPLPGPKEKEEHVKEVVSAFMRIYGGKDPLPTKSVL